MCTASNRPVPVLSEKVIRALEMYDWPGNVRELENALARALVIARGSSIGTEHLVLGAVGDEPDTDRAPGDLALGSVERAHVLHVLRLAKGNKSSAARLLRISRQRLDRILDRHGISAAPADGTA
jgi:DNA-binding NtrC family response regulator